MLQLLLAAPSSGRGKTTAACALLSALKARGLEPCAFKCGPEFHSDGNQRRDYIYVDDLIDLAMRVWDQPGFDAVNVSSNKNYSVRELYATACELMGKQIEAKYCPSSHYWAKYPELYGGAYGIKPEILDHEVNKYSLCDNTHAKECYGWEPKIDIREGLRRVIENECAMLAARDAKGE